jgi:hypothetical protein
MITMGKTTVRTVLALATISYKHICLTRYGSHDLRVPVHPSLHEWKDLANLKRIACQPVEER